VISRVWEATMEYCRSPDGVTSVSVRPYYATMLSHVYLALAMGFLVTIKSSSNVEHDSIRLLLKDVYWQS